MATYPGTCCTQVQYLCAIAETITRRASKATERSLLVTRPSSLQTSVNSLGPLGLACAACHLRFPATSLASLFVLARDSRIVSISTQTQPPFLFSSRNHSRACRNQISRRLQLIPRVSAPTSNEPRSPNSTHSSTSLILRHLFVQHPVSSSARAVPWISPSNQLKHHRQTSRRSSIVLIVTRHQPANIKSYHSPLRKLRFVPLSNYTRPSSLKPHRRAPARMF